MDNKDTNKVTQFERKAQSKRRERAVLLLSAAFVLSALTLTGVYMSRSGGQDSEIEESTRLEEEQNLNAGVTKVEEGLDLQSVDSGTVENPDRVIAKTPASKTSNDLVEAGIEENVQENVQDILTEAVMSEVVESQMLSFDGSQMIWPVSEESNIIIPYSMEKAVYFETLDQYKYSPAMIIEAEVGTPVCAVSAGKITGRYWDYETGWTYEMDLGGGFKAYYGQLDNMQKAEETYVAAGDVLGYVASPTKYYTEEGSNLYFAMTKKDKPVYPMDYMGE